MNDDAYLLLILVLQNRLNMSEPEPNPIFAPIPELLLMLQKVISKITLTQPINQTLRPFA